VKFSEVFRQLDLLDVSLGQARSVSGSYPPSALGLGSLPNKRILGLIEQGKAAKQKLEAEFHKADGGPTRTAMGSLSNGTGSALAYSVETNTPANAFELILPQGTAITGASTPSGFSCTNTGNVEECKNGSVRPNTPVTGTFDHTGTIAANCGCVQVAFSGNDGKTWFPRVKLTGPPSTLSGVSLSLTCSATVPLYGELEYGGTLTPPVAGAQVIVVTSEPTGATLTHTLPVDATTGKYGSSFGVPYSGNWISQAHYGNIDSLTCTTVVAGG